MEEIAKQVPALAVLCWLVFMFLKHLREERRARQENYQARDAALKQTLDNNTDCIRECAASMAQSAELMRQNTAALQALNRRDSGPQRRAAIGS